MAAEALTLDFEYITDLVHVTDKLTFKFSNGGDIKDAFQDLDGSITLFNEEAETCNQLRVGRVEETGNAVKEVVDTIKSLLEGKPKRTPDSY